ncbi:hypothetical protein XENORESO_020701 [Xenotaenia resolanae]|uniref:Uncharacterized protein n=1 Tax=Xenotaenia resolanae TaxID=208358 RepID=A0ABV0WZN9_9TELE
MIFPCRNQDQIRVPDIVSFLLCVLSSFLPSFHSLCPNLSWFLPFFPPSSLPSFLVYFLWSCHSLFLLFHCLSFPVPFPSLLYFLSCTFLLPSFLFVISCVLVCSFFIKS